MGHELTPEALKLLEAIAVDVCKETTEEHLQITAYIRHLKRKMKAKEHGN